MARRTPVPNRLVALQKLEHLRVNIGYLYQIVYTDSLGSGEDIPSEGQQDYIQKARFPSLL